MMKRTAKRTAAVVLVLGLAVTLLTGCSLTGKTQEPVSAAYADGKEYDSDNAQARREFLQKYREDDGVNQLLLVSHTEGTEAKVWFYDKNKEENNAWNLVFESDAIIGKNGMGKEKEGDSKTPYGEYEITGAFGIMENPGTDLPYTDITEDTYACDEEGAYYNQIIDAAAEGHDCSGEEMYALSPEYNYGATLSYNSDNTYPDGSAVFLHCKGLKPFTGGCVALSEEDMKTVLVTAEPGARILLDEMFVAE